jgi:hypothetical protein
MAVFGDIKRAIANLNPAEVLETASKPVRIGMVAASHDSLGRMESYFIPPHLSPDRRAAAARMLLRDGTADCDVVIYESCLLRPANAFSFDLESPEDSVREILRRRNDLSLALARQFYPFRKPAAFQLIRGVAKENAMFSLMTALPDVIPSLASLPWAIGEFGSDTAFLTANQIRMTFMLAGGSDRAPGYREQRNEIASIIAGAFGWKALARELVGKVPFGGGLIPKAAIAWAGTFVVGLSLERLYSVGYGFTRIERKSMYEEAYQHGREIAGRLLEGIKERKAV